MGMCGGQTEDEATAPYLKRPDYVYHRLQQSLTRGELWGSPGTDGTLKANIIDNLKGDHSILGICFAHPMHPFSKTERLIFMFSALTWLLFLQAIFFQSGTEMDSFLEGFIIALLVWPWKKWVRTLMECACFYDSKYDPTYFDNLNDSDFDAADVKKAALGCLEWLGSLITCGNVVWSILFLVFGILLINASPDGNSFVGEWVYTQCMSLFVTEVATIVFFTFLAGYQPKLPFLGEAEKAKFERKWIEQDAYWTEDNLPVSYTQVAALAKWDFILVNPKGGQKKFDTWFKDKDYDGVFSITDEVNGFYKDLKQREADGEDVSKAEEGSMFQDGKVAVEEVEVEEITAEKKM